MTVALSGLVLIYFLFFLRDIFCHVYYDLYDHCELCEQYYLLSQEMTGQTCYLETVQLGETPVKICVMHYNELSD